MSNFSCEKCGIGIIDSPRGYIAGCEHHPPDVKPMRGYGTMTDIDLGITRRWFIDEYGTKRWGDDNTPVLQEAK